MRHYRIGGAEGSPALAGISNTALRLNPGFRPFKGVV